MSASLCTLHLFSHRSLQLPAHVSPPVQARGATWHWKMLLSLPGTFSTVVWRLRPCDSLKMIASHVWLSPQPWSRYRPLQLSPRPPLSLSLSR